jgi:hypothetical protein
MTLNRIKYLSLTNRYLRGFFFITFSWLAVVFMRVFGPITYSSIGDDFLFFIFYFLFVSMASYTLGFFISYKAQHKIRTSLVESHSISSVFNGIYLVIIYLAILYTVFAFYDFFYLKGGHLGQLNEMREAGNIAGGRGSIIGAIVALLSATPAMLLVLILTKGSFKTVNKIKLLVVIALGFGATFLSGGRNPFFIGLLFTLSYYWLFLRSEKLAVKQKKIGFEFYIFLLIVVLSISFSMNIFIERAALRGASPEGMVIYLAAYENIVQIYSYRSSSIILTSLYSIFVYLTYYITHALNFANDYFSVPFEYRAMGAYSFPQITRLVDGIIGTNFFGEVRDILLVNGAYLTLPGSLYIDFGFLGTMIISFIMGFWFGYFMRNIANLSLYQKVITAYFLILYLLAPMYLVLGMGSGFSMLFLIVVIVIMSIRLRV